MPPATENASSFEAECRKRGLAVTVQRRTVFEAVSARRDHPTADQVYEAVRGRIPGLSRTTVYRVLDTLVEKGFVRRVQHAGSVTRFDPMTERHHHLVCDECGKVDDFTLPDTVEGSLDQALRRAARKQGYRPLNHRLDLTGTCPECLAR